MTRISSKSMRNAACVAAFVGAVCVPSTARAQTWVVSNFTDDPQNAPVGSLREALGGAHPGDTITFKFSGVVQLKGPLAVPQFAAGLVIQGRAELRPAAGANAPLTIYADNVKVDSMTFQNVDLNIDQNVVGTQILGCDFIGTSAIDVDRAKNTVIGSVAEPNTFAGRSGTDITLFNDDDTSIVGNTFSGTGFAVDGDTSDTLLIDQNTSKGPVILLTPTSANVTNNTITAKGGAAGIMIESVGATSDLPDPVLIDRNTIKSSGVEDGIHVERVNVTISNNTVSGEGRATGIFASCGGDENFSAGPIAISTNTVSKFFDGIVFTCDDAQSPTVSMANDTSSANKDFGVAATVGPLAMLTMESETATGNGKGKSGGGAKFDVNGSGVDVKASKFDGNVGVGVQASSRGGELTFEDGEMNANRQDGLLVSQGAGRLSFDHVLVEQNKGDGMHFGNGAKGEVHNGTVRNNAKSGLFADTGSLVWSNGTNYMENGGPGIDLADGTGKNAVTPNSVTKTANRNIGWPDPLVFDPSTGTIKGTTGAFFVVEVFTIEGQPRAGNPHNGEGFAFGGFTTADAQGQFSWPPSGQLTCLDAEKLTFTATDPTSPDPVTSEFSPDIACGATSGNWLKFSAKSLTVPTVKVGNDTSTTLTVTNTSSQMVDVTVQQPGGGEWFVFPFGDVMIAAGAKQDFTIGFSTFTAGPTSANYKFESACIPGGSLTVKASGTATK